MSGASPSPGVSSTAPPGGAFHRVREFWERISEGRQLDDLWSQFAADARAGYGFYGKDVDWDAIQKLPRWRSEERRVGKECRLGWSPGHLEENEGDSGLGTAVVMHVLGCLDTIGAGCSMLGTTD